MHSIPLPQTAEDSLPPDEFWRSAVEIAIKMLTRWAKENRETGFFEGKVRAECYEEVADMMQFWLDDNPRDTLMELAVSSKTPNE